MLVVCTSKRSAHACQQLPLIVQAYLVLHIEASAFHAGVVVTRYLQRTGVLVLPTGASQRYGRHADPLMQQRIAALFAQLQAHQ